MLFDDELITLAPETVFETLYRLFGDVLILAKYGNLGIGLVR